MASNPQGWQKALLAGGLLLMLVYGLFQIPEVAGRTPEALWAIKLQQLQKECGIIAERLQSATATLETLQDRPGEIPVAGFWDSRLHTAQKDCISLYNRVRYVNAKLLVLRVALEKRRQGASPALAAKLAGLGAQIDQIQSEGRQLSLTLESAQEKLRAVKLAQARRKDGRI